MFHLALRFLPFTGPSASSKSSVHLEHSGPLNRLYSKLIYLFHSCEVAACQSYGYQILWGHENMKSEYRMEQCPIQFGLIGGTDAHSALFLIVPSIKRGAICIAADCVAWLVRLCPSVKRPFALTS